MNNKMITGSEDDVIILEPLVLTLKRPVTFEGKEYNRIDLNNLDDWSVDDLVNVTKKFKKMTGGDDSLMGSILPESNIEYDMFVAAEASGLPIDFFKKLPAREIGPLKSIIISFFHGTV